MYVKIMFPPVFEKVRIHIEYDGIGFIPLEELAKKETA